MYFILGPRWTLQQTQEDMLDFEGRNKVLYIAWCFPAYSNGWKKNLSLTRAWKQWEMGFLASFHEGAIIV